jgi:hypothetical protein
LVADDEITVGDDDMVAVDGNDDAMLVVGGND